MVIALASLAACASMKSGFDYPAKHPYEVEQGQRPTCTECHDKRDANVDYQRFNHNPYFMDQPPQAGLPETQVCAMCHTTSFCNDCHNTGIELKPSIKNQTENYRRVPTSGRLPVAPPDRRATRPDILFPLSRQPQGLENLRSLPR